MQVRSLQFQQLSFVAVHIICCSQYFVQSCSFLSPSNIQYVLVSVCAYISSHQLIWQIEVPQRENSLPLFQPCKYYEQKKQINPALRSNTEGNFGLTCAGNASLFQKNTIFPLIHICPMFRTKPLITSFYPCIYLRFQFRKSVCTLKVNHVTRKFNLSGYVIFSQCTISAENSHFCV